MSDASVPGKGLTRLEWTVILVVFALGSPFIFRPLFFRPTKGPHSNCISNVKQIELGVIMYSGDYDDRMPKAAHWMDDMYPYLKNEYILHDTVDDGGYGYAYRKALSGVDSKELQSPAMYVMVYDSTDTRRNATGDLSLLPNPGRHYGKDTIGFADGHVNPRQADGQFAVLRRDDADAGPASRPKSKGRKP